MAENPYHLETVSRACQLLRVFADEHEAVKLCELVRRTGLNKTIVFRLAHTLEESGLLERTTERTYRSRCRLLDRKRLRIGYAAQAEDSLFSAVVTESIRRSGAREGIDLIIVDNQYSPSVALRNARRLVDSRVDVALEFQTYVRTAPAISALFREAGIPLVAIEIPHPNAIFYGADNYRIGLDGGRFLGRWARQHWDGKPDEVLLLELQIAGSVPQLRLAGTAAGIREVIPRIRPEQFISLDVKGEFERAFELVRKRLQRTGARRTLITAVNDPSVLGALRAFEEAGLAENCAAVALGALPEVRSELRKPNSRLIGSIAFFPERYGDDIVQLALDIANHRPVPSAVYAKHQLITIANVDRFYPADRTAGLQARLNRTSRVG